MQTRLGIVCGVLTLVGAACTATAGPTTTLEVASSASITSAPTTTTTAAAGPPRSHFRNEVDEVTASLLALQPELITELGAGSIIGFDADYLLDDVSGVGRQSVATAATAGIARLDALDKSDLSADEKLSLDVLRWYLDDAIVMGGFVQYENPVNFITGAHANFGEYMADVHPIGTEQDAENYLARLAAFPGQIRDLIDRLEVAAAGGIVPAETSLGIARWQIQNAIGNGAGATHPFVTDLMGRVEALPDENASWAAGIGAKAEAIVEDRIAPALEELDDSVRSLDGRSNSEVGAVFLPGGSDYYAAVLRHFIAVDMTPEQVHQVGLEQVDRVSAELREKLDALGYGASGDFVGAIRQAATDAGAMPTTSQSERAEVLSETIATVEAAGTVFADQFTVRPRAALDVVRPRPGREGGSGAYYRPPPIDGSRGGVFYLSLGGSEFPLLTMDTTTYHEAVPGHHFQLGIQRSLDQLPLHQRVFDFTGFTEGWALYAERLAYEAGLYDDNPLGNIGRLRMELLRASRMVVDTGIHWYGWSRNDAVDYMLNLGFDRGQAEAEVDRYIVWPGQAPAYMIGMLEILRLRDAAEVELADAFDITGFHDALLSQGSVPVGLLEQVIARWIDSVR